MLKYFEVTNFKGFENKFTMDLSKTKNYEFNDKCVANGIARFVQCYGPNGSGKSNLGISILDIESHLTDNYANKSYYSNYLNASSSLSAAEFKYEFQFDSKTVVYEYKKDRQAAPIRESLWIDGELVVYLNRETDEPPIVRLSGTETLIFDDIKKNEISLVKFVAKNSILIKNEINETFVKFLDFVEHMLYFRSLLDTSFIGFKTSSGESILDFIVKSEMLLDFEEFLKSMGLHYKLVSIDDQESERKSIGVSFGTRTKRLWDIASTGTRALVIFYYWLKQVTLQNSPSFVFIDEFDAFYHFKIAETISKKLSELHSHQIMLTTHNTGLFSNEISRPDCNFIIKENSVVPIYLLTPKELRSAHNIEKMYRAGGFDAV